MMGMGFLRLNKVLSKQKWSAEEEVENEERGRRERKNFIVALVIVLIFLGIVIYLAT